MGDRQGAAGLEDEVIYTKYIKEREDWEFAGMYTDEGVTGTSTKKREGFTRMIKDALDGKIQLIITNIILPYLIQSYLWVQSSKVHLSTKNGHETKKIRHKNIILVQDTLILLTSSRKPPDILCQP